MQGGTIAPLIANIALHGLETIMNKRFPRSGSRGLQAPKIVVYADDLVILHEERQIVRQCQERAPEWLQDIGLRLQPSQTRITQTLVSTEETPGFDFLGKHAAQEPLMQALNPQSVGWSNDYAHVTSARVFQTLDNTVYARLRGGAVSRHPNKKKHWITSTYWRVDEGKGWTFQAPHGGVSLARHAHTSIQRQVKVQGARRPYDGDWVYWSRRIGRHPDVPPRVATLLKQQQGQCRECRGYFMHGDKMEVDHIIPTAQGGRETRDNLQLLHRHGHERKTARETGCEGTHDTRHVAEEPDERKRSRPVLEPSRGGDTPA